MKLLHYSSEVLESLNPCCYLQCLDSKPSGLWVSVEEVVASRDNRSWAEWCEAEDFHQERLRYVHEIRLVSDANILYLDTVDKMYAFNKMYQKPVVLSPNSVSFFKVDWQSVSDAYQGIVIAPWRWSLRLESRFVWYYGWDCSSGCIWDLDALSSISLLV